MRLVFDTSSRNISLGLLDNGNWIFTKDHWEPKHQQSRLILKLLQDSLKEQQIKPSAISEIGVGVGPGSFTGLRVGLTIAKIWAFSKEIPTWSFSSERLLQRTIKQEPSSEYPKVKYLEIQDFEKVDDLIKLKPIYQNDHFSENEQRSPSQN